MSRALVLLLCAAFALATPTIRRSRHVSRSAKLPSFFSSTDDLTIGGKALNDALAGCTQNQQHSFARVHHEDGLTSVELELGAAEHAVNAAPPLRVLFVHGEHARELIAPELALRLIRDICDVRKGAAAENLDADYRSRLSHLVTGSNSRRIIMKIVPVANPQGRKLVEAGAFCRRTNERGVDINRNYDSHWLPADPHKTHPDSYPGSSPFSEPQSQALRGIIQEFRPHLFLSVHSGTRGLYSPPAYSPVAVEAIYKADHRRGEEIRAMREVLDVIAGESAPVSQSSTGLIVGESEHAAGPIPIPHGGAAQEVGYPCPGNCLDYSHENARVPYSFAFEIYGPPTVRMATKSADASAPSIFLEQSSAASTSTEEGQGQLEEGHVDADGELYDVSLGSCFLETASSSSSGESKAAAISVHTGGRRSQSHGGHGHGRGGLSTLMTAEQCLSFFNPTDEQQFHNTLDEWSFRSVRLIEEVLKRVEAKAAQVAGQ